MRFALAVLALVCLTAPLLAAPNATPGRTVLVALDQPDALAGRDLRTTALTPTGTSDLSRRYVLVEPAGEPTATAADLRTMPGVAAAMVVGTRELFWVPNDPYLGAQWHLQTGNTASIRIAEAWDLWTGDDGAVIAVIDTGVDWSHPDLSAKVWQNPGEIPANGLDDDANGYVDDWRGWDCGMNDNDARPAAYHELGLDVGFHGTHCAGIAGAATNNGVGIAGAAPGCPIMPLKVTQGDAITDAAITMAFVYAIENGADVVSMSFGGPDQGGAAAFYQDLVDQALAAGVVCVAAAGNDDSATRMYPAACTGVISVGATDPSGARASYSSYGTWVTVNAPGSQIWSTIHTNYELDFLTALLFQLSYGWDGVNPYMYSDGTSMACPMVAGVVGLVRSRAPQLASEQVAQLLIDTGDVVSFDQPIGVKVNAEAALLALDVTAAPEVPVAVSLSGAPNPFNPRTSLRFELAAAAVVWLEILDVRGRRVRTLVAGETLAGGAHTRIWDGADESGRAMPSGVYLARLQGGVEASLVKLVLAR